MSAFWVRSKISAEVLLMVWLAFLTRMVPCAELENGMGNEDFQEEFHVAPETGRIYDTFGRERIFHGLNVVVKDAPWHPLVGSLDARFSFTDFDVALLKGWGMTVVRLGIMWPGVEPIRGHVNSTYIEVIQSIVKKLHRSGIYTLLEFHQDLYSSPFCGEGLPSWILDSDGLTSSTDKCNSSSAFQKSSNETESQALARIQREDQAEEASAGGLESSNQNHDIKSATNPSKYSRHYHVLKRSERSGMLSRVQYPASFPEPLGRRWPWPSDAEKDGWEPSIESCSQHKWWFYYLSYAVSRAFQDLYDNNWGWTDLLARYWTVVAEAFKNQPGILGYELMNEPWPGDVFYNPLLFLPGVADASNLSQFYEKLQAAVRSVDKKRILFFETITFDNFRCGWKSVPGGKQWRNKTVLSYHYYKPPNFSTRQTFAERSRESKRLGCGSMLTEFFVSADHYKSYKQFWDIRDRILKAVTKRREMKRRSKASAFCLKNTEIERLKQTISNPRVDSVGRVLLSADDYVQSWIGWEYKAFFNKTGSIVEQSLFDASGKLNVGLAKTLARTYPQAVCGTIKSYSFDPSSSKFSLTFLAKPEFESRKQQAFTEIYVHRGFYYPQGLTVELSQPCASFSETETLIRISHTSACGGILVDIKISRKGSLDLN